MKHLKFFIFLCILTFTVSCGQQKKYVQYKLKKGETITSVAKKLDMNTRDLFRLNPDIGTSPKANTVIIVPNKEMKTVRGTKENNGLPVGTKLDTNDILTKEVDILITDKENERILLIETLEKAFKIHEVKKGDTFYNLTRLYDVSKEDLLNLNPELSNGLKLGQLIKIAPMAQVFETENLIYEDEIEKGVSLKAAIMLPFRGAELDTLTSNEIFLNSKLATIVTDFYLGAEIAIDSLRKQGVELQIEVYDTGRNGTKIKAITAENNLNKNDVIIGPLYSEEVTYLAKMINTPIVIPFYSKSQSAFSNNTIVKSSPSKQFFRDKLLHYIQENFHDGNIIIVGDGNADSNLNSRRIEKVLKSHDSINNITIITPEKGYIKKEKFTKVLKPNMKNIVVMTTDDNVIVASAINSLISLPEEVTVSVFTFDMGSAFNKIDNAKLAMLGFTYVSDEFIREDSFKAMAFNRKYLAKNKALPSFYATKGFDVTYDILMRLASGRSLKATFKDGYSYRVESKFDYTDTSLKVPENKGLFIVKYNTDLTLTRIE